MSADATNEVSSILDEDVLRKMWQETEDFGAKKEIRSHMYKLREQRLKEFYNNGEVSSQIRTTTTSGGKSCDAPKHADSLADDSFLSLKSKEIRDSESPTRDVSYKITDKRDDKGWQVVTTNERSADGKTHITEQLATTSGSQKIEGGKVDYAAKNQQTASVYKDGDEKNFTKSVGAQSNTVIQQQAVGGDENSNFKTSSTKTSSSSRVVTEHKSTTDDLQPIPSTADPNSALVSRKVYTDNIPSDLKKHPGFVEGRTKVTRETKTMPDGSTVTTTRYEVRGESTSQSSVNHQHSAKVSSSSEQKSSYSTKKQVHSSDQRSDANAIDYVTDRSDYVIAKDQAQDVGSTKKNQRFTDEFVDTRIIRSQNERTDQRRHQEQKVNVAEESKNIVGHHVEVGVSQNQVVSSQNQIVEEQHSQQQQKNQEVISEKNRKKKTRGMEEMQRSIQVIKDGNDANTRELIPVEEDRTTRISTIMSQPVENSTRTSTTTIVRGKQDSRDNRKIVSDQFINVERQHEKDTREIIETAASPTKKPAVKPIDSSPERKNPISQGTTQRTFASSSPQRRSRTLRATGETSAD
ncbi:hypothetical protein NQ317_001701 [Molorchus minor]|uniref:Smoothelin domain-containing protein n=1 Tax=Molorchus minor TaxID=1323400 RepID=A0ABQ9J546_9CUCU|nr:hypothetical protein NQ317_001701 [Molorchus minor]